MAFLDKDEDFESFSEPFESRLCLLKLSSVPLDTEHNRNPASNRSQKLPQRENGNKKRFGVWRKVNKWSERRR